MQETGFLFLKKNANKIMPFHRISVCYATYTVDLNTFNFEAILNPGIFVYFVHLPGHGEPGQR
jgi:hypothetical protein